MVLLETAKLGGDDPTRRTLPLFGLAETFVRSKKLPSQDKLPLFPAAEPTAIHTAWPSPRTADANYAIRDAIRPPVFVNGTVDRSEVRRYAEAIGRVQRTGGLALHQCAVGIVDTMSTSSGPRLAAGLPFDASGNLGLPARAQTARGAPRKHGSGKDVTIIKVAGVGYGGGTLANPPLKLKPRRVQTPVAPPTAELWPAGEQPLAPPPKPLTPRPPSTPSPVRSPRAMSPLYGQQERATPDPRAHVEVLCLQKEMQHVDHSLEDLHWQQRAEKRLTRPSAEDSQDLCSRKASIGALLKMDHTIVTQTQRSAEVWKRVGHACLLLQAMCLHNRVKKAQAEADHGKAAKAALRITSIMQKNAEFKLKVQKDRNDALSGLAEMVLNIGHQVKRQSSGYGDKVHVYDTKSNRMFWVRDLMLKLLTEEPELKEAASRKREGLSKDSIKFTGELQLGQPQDAALGLVHRRTIPPLFHDDAPRRNRCPQDEHGLPRT